MGFQQGLSGLNSASKALDVVGNNVSNSGTVGFKTARAQFADVFAASLSGAGGASQVGIGTRINSVAQQFTQGNISITSNSLDIAINGNGMFQLADPSGALSYTRNGQFQLDKNGFLVNADGLNVQGYPANFATSSLGVINSTTPANIFIDPTPLQPQQTSKGTLDINLDARGLVPPAGHESFDPADPLSYNSSTSLSIYDSLGNVHTLSTYYIYAGQVPDAALPPDALGNPPTVSTWQVRYSLDGIANQTTAFVPGNDPWTDPDLAPAPIPPAVTPPPVPFTAGDNITLCFDTSGQLVDYATGGGAGAALTFQGALTPAPALTIDFASALGAQNKATTPMTINTLDYSACTQFGTPFGVNSLLQDGYPSGRLTGVSVSQDGVIQGRYTNGQTRNMAQVILARFTNPNGLQSVGGNQWQETFSSGVPLIGAPGSASNGLLQSSALEESTVDLTKELVDMITFQRSYQANAQTIKTQDSVLQTIVNLR